MKYELNKKIQHKEGESFIETILRARGIEDCKAYLHTTEDSLYSPLLLDNIEVGAERFLYHVTVGSKIFLIVDCDNDGVTSAAEIYLFAKKINPQVEIKWMMHEGKQHGIELERVPEDTEFVIVPDAGSNQEKEHKELTARGIEVLVLDHHLVDSPVENSPAIIINNQTCDYPNKDLSGAGVVLKFIDYCSQITGISSIYDFMDLAAVGIVGDMMNLKNPETRYIVNYGLSHLNNPGIKAFVNKQAFSIGGTDSLTPIDVSFYITPLINAVIRVGTMEEKELLFRAFIDGLAIEASSKRGAKPGDMEVVGDKAARIATNCKNRQAKAKEKSVDLIDMKIQKEELNDNKTLIIALDEWESKQVNPNLTGLIAMEILAKYKKPTLIIREGDDNIFKGSGRSDDCSLMANFKDYLSDSGLVEYAQGHEAAFGCGIKAANLDNLNRKINNEFEGVDLGTTSYLVDFVFDMPNNQADDIALDIFKYNFLWGRGVEEPLVAVTGIVDTTKLFVMGADKKSSKINVNGIDCVKFKDGDFIAKMQEHKFAHVVFIGKLKINNYNGNITTQLFIDDYEIKNFNREF